MGKESQPGETPDNNIPNEFGDKPGHPIRKPSFKTERLMVDKFGLPLKAHREIAQGLFGETVDPNNLTEEENNKVEAAYRGFREGWDRGLEKFFEELERKNPDDIHH